MSKHGRNGWENAQLKDLGTWSGGGTPSKGRSELWKDGSVPWVSPKDMKRLFIDETIDRITEFAIGESAVKLIPENSVLMVTRSGILAHTFPVCINTVSVTVNQDIKALTPYNGIAYRYLAYGLRAFGNVILRDCSKDGTTVASVDTEALHSFHFPLAPHPEQHRIVEAIESYLTRLDDAVATLERVQRNLKRYRASVLKAAVEGRLVPTEAELARKENREYEPASVLLERILKERKHRFIEDAAEKGHAKAEARAKSAGKTWTDADDEKTLAAERAKAAKKYQEPIAPDTSELPKLPEGWCWAAVDQIAAITGGLTKNANRDSLPLHVPYLRVANVYADELRLDGMKKIGVTPQERDRTLLEIGDLLIVEGNGSAGQIGRAALWDGSISGCCHQNHLIKARLIDTDLGRWSLQWFLSSRGRRAIVRQASSTSGLHTLSISKIRGLSIPLAPKIEITRISVEVDRLISLAENSADIANTTLKRTKRFRQSILKWAFEGKLVDQDPNDEPASALLERLKAERSTSGPSTKTTRSRRKRKTA